MEKAGGHIMIKAIPGIQWAADIMTGQQPIPWAKTQEKPKDSGDGFKAVFDEAMDRLKAEERR